jgi:hypothetical protein
VLEFGIFRDAEGPSLQPLIDITHKRTDAHT